MLVQPRQQWCEMERGDCALLQYMVTASLALASVVSEVKFLVDSATRSYVVLENSTTDKRS